MRSTALAAATGLVVTAAVLFASSLHAAVVRDGQVVMGTVLTVTVVAGDRTSAESLARASIEEARRWDDALTIWRPGGELFRLNARAGQGAITVSHRLAQGLLAMLELSRETSGAFDAAVLARPPAHVPWTRPRTSREVLAIRPSRGPAQTFEATLANDAALDPGAIGKGLALDAIAALLVRGGAEAAFLDFGGSSQTAIGSPPGDGKGWPVVLAGLAPGASHGTLHLRDASISTSRSGAIDTTPVLDPQTGHAVSGARLATVRAPTATAADAWSTALVVLGEGGIAAAGAAGLEVLLEGAGRVHRTPAFGVATALEVPAPSSPRHPHPSRELPRRPPRSLENESQVLHDPGRSVPE